MSKDIKNMREYRQKTNEIILNSDKQNIKRFFALDSRAYDPGTIDKKQRS